MVCARANDVDPFLLIDPLGQAMDASDDIDETNTLIDSLGDIAIEDINYTICKIEETLKYKPIQQINVDEQQK